jgi:Ca-activated chloride channel homolog
VKTLRFRSALRLVAAAALVVPVAACDDKKASVGYAPSAGGAYARQADAKMAGESPPPPPAAEKAANTEAYEHFVENTYVAAAREPRSTFSASVDTAAYALIRAKINAGGLPPKDAVRIADMLNYFEYENQRPTGDAPVWATVELASCPWNAKHHLLRIGVAAKKYDPSELPARNLVFLVDTSGSMSPGNRLPLVKQSLLMLVDTLSPRDRVSLVTYAGESSLRLPPTPGDQKARIRAAIEALSAGGSTNGGGGIETAYAQAAQSFIEHGVNRVILATDGDFNVGVRSQGDLIRLIEEKRKTGVYLTVLGFGMGNLKDANLEKIAHHGNGHYAYIDTPAEAHKLFVEQGGSLVTVAKDVKLQVDFNPARVNAYRLVGYENRLLSNQDFRNDEKDAGDMGSGHTVTALYEVVPVGVTVPLADAGESRYQTAVNTPAAKTGEWLTFRMRFKDPATEEAKEVSFPVGKDGLRSTGSRDFRFAAAVAEFGLLLRDSPYKGTATWADVRELATGVGFDPNGHRAEFVELVGQAERLMGKRD